MSWKCPQCGEVENTDDQMHCTCGHEMSDAELAAAKVAAAQIVEAGNQPEEQLEPSGFTYAVRTCQFLALLSTFWFNYYEDKKYGSTFSLLSFFIFMLLVITDSMHRKQISLKFQTIRKKDIPSMYNFFIVLYMIIAVSVLAKVISELGDLGRTPNMRLEHASLRSRFNRNPVEQLLHPD